MGTSTIVKILDEEYRIGCPASSESDLQDAAYFFNQQLQELKSSGKLVGKERMLVMVGLNLCHLLLKAKAKDEESTLDAEAIIKSIEGKVDKALSTLHVSETNEA